MMHNGPINSPSSKARGSHTLTTAKWKTVVWALPRGPGRWLCACRRAAKPLSHHRAVRMVSKKADPAMNANQGEDLGPYANTTSEKKMVDYVKSAKRHWQENGSPAENGGTKSANTGP
eukprot:comp18067_c0_seq1/m.18651 comp18067_c0_seq1/g.18651  ORF comp18067_c0_seq1/g.18651 comp18067_c0_seq1/m.18651 type:complete len:118 (-) comp18067_c0_seq1:79-432(-)